jgi:hypothetical protein
MNRPGATALACVVLLAVAATASKAQERVRIDGQVQWVAGTRMQVMTSGGSVAVDLRRADQASHRGLRTGDRVIVDGAVADDRRSLVATDIWHVGWDQNSSQAP